MDYSIMTDEDGQQRECDSCGFATALEEFTIDDQYHKGEKRVVYICELCSSTQISSATLEYPKHYDDRTKTVLGTIGWVANRVLYEIRNPNGPIPPSN